MSGSRIYLTVYFNGTSLTLKPLDKENKFGVEVITWTLPSFLYQEKCTERTETSVVRGYDGSGVTHGWLGEIYGWGLDAAFDELEKIIKDANQADHPVTLNVFGVSRGAISAMLLALKLKDIDTTLLNINLLLHEPVPGNARATVAIDGYDVTLTNQVMDMRACQNLTRVSTIYTNETEQLSWLGTCLPFSPLRTRLFPSTCQVEETVVQGAHSSVQRIWETPGYYRFSMEKLVLFGIVHDFLADCGTPLLFEHPLRYLHIDAAGDKHHKIIETEKQLNTAIKEIYAQQLENLRIKQKSDLIYCHGEGTPYIASNYRAQYLNTDHQRRCGVPSNDADCALRVETLDQEYSANMIGGISGVIAGAGVGLMLGIIISPLTCGASFFACIALGSLVGFVIGLISGAYYDHCKIKADIEKKQAASIAAIPEGELPAWRRKKKFSFSTEMASTLFAEPVLACKTYLSKESSLAENFRLQNRGNCR